jgi:hypothetical protein
MSARITVCTFALWLISAPAYGAELFYMDHDPYTDRFVGPIGPLVFSGEIIPGDYAALLSKILADRDRFLAQNKLILASDGGDVAEAIKIAKLVKSLYTVDRALRQCVLLYLCRRQSTRGRRGAADRHQSALPGRLGGTIDIDIGSGACECDHGGERGIGDGARLSRGQCRTQVSLG